MKPQNDLDDNKKRLFASETSSILSTEASASSEDVEMTAITETEVKIRIDSFQSKNESIEVIQPSASFSSNGNYRSISDTISSANDFNQNVIFKAPDDSHQSPMSFKCVSGEQDFKQSSKALGEGSAEKNCQSPKKHMLKTSQDDDDHTSTEPSQSIFGETSTPAGTIKHADGNPKITATILDEGGNGEEGNPKVTETEQLKFPHVSQYNESQVEKEMELIMNLWDRIDIIKTQLKEMGIIFPCTEQPDGESTKNTVASTSCHSTSADFSISEKQETVELSRSCASSHPAVLKSRTELSCEEYHNSETVEGSSPIHVSIESEQKISSQVEMKERDALSNKSKSPSKLVKTDAYTVFGPAEFEEMPSDKRFINNLEPAADPSTLNVSSGLQQEMSCNPEIEYVLQPSESISPFDIPSSEVWKRRKMSNQREVIKIKKDIIAIMRDIAKAIPGFRLIINRLSPALRTQRTDFLLNTARDILKALTALQVQCHRLLSRIQANQVERMIQSVDFSRPRSFEILEKERSILNDTFGMMNEVLQLLRQCKDFSESYEKQ